MRLLRLALACSAALVSAVATAQPAYPTRPIRMVVPLAAASAVDNAARIVTQKMAENMGQQVTIINQPGAAGLIGAREVAKAEPDGYTLGGFNDSIMTMIPNLQANMPWDIVRDFEPVSLVATVEWGLVASKGSGWTTAVRVTVSCRTTGRAAVVGSAMRHLLTPRYQPGRGVSRGDCTGEREVSAP